MGVNLKKYCRVKGAIAHRGRSLASTIALLLTAKGCQRKAAFVFFIYNKLFRYNSHKHNSVQCRL